MQKQLKLFAKKRVFYCTDIVTGHVTDPTSNVMFYPFFFSPGFFWIVLCVTMGCFTSNVIRKENEEKMRLKTFKVGTTFYNFTSNKVLNLSKHYS